jgi:hAT family C-terminal dimerisation region
MSRIQSILRKNSGSPSTSTPRATEMQFWHQVKGVFQILASMTCDILTVPISTVASESCFSAVNRVLTDKRTRLGERVFEALVLLKDWYDAESRLQDRSWMYQIDREEG